MYFGDIHAITSRGPKKQGTVSTQSPQSLSSKSTSIGLNEKKKLLSRPLLKRHWLILGAGLCIALLCGSIVFWRLFIWQPAVVNPFANFKDGTISFPLYYPVLLPPGFHINAKSVTTPQTGVVLFNLVGPHGEKIYISEEARPQSFDLGGFYKQFQGLKEIGVPDGAIAAGKLANGQMIASRANSKTWILSNTNAHVDKSQLLAMLKSIVGA